MPATCVRRRPRRNSATPATRRRPPACPRGERGSTRSNEAFTSPAVSGGRPRSATSGREREPERCVRRRRSLPPLAERRDQVALRVGRDERLEDVGARSRASSVDLDRRRARASATGFASATTSVPPRGTASSCAFSRGLEPRRPPPGSGWPARTRRAGWRRWRRAKELARGSRRRPRARGLRCPRSTQRPRLLAAPRLPRRLGREQQRARRAGRSPCSLEDADRALGLAQRRRRCRPPSGSARASSSRASPSSARSPSHSSSRNSSAVFAARAASSALKASSDACAQAQAVLDGLLGHVALREVVDELREARARAGPRSASRAARRTAGGASAGARAREPGVEHVAHDAAREGQQVAARLALLLEQPSRTSRSIASSTSPCASASASRSRESKVLPMTEAIESRSRRSSGSRSIALLDRLLDRRRQRVGGDAAVPARGSTRRCRPARCRPESMQRAHELLREERVPSVAS